MLNCESPKRKTFFETYFVWDVNTFRHEIEQLYYEFLNVRKIQLVNLTYKGRFLLLHKIFGCTLYVSIEDFLPLCMLALLLGHVLAMISLSHYDVTTTLIFFNWWGKTFIIWSYLSLMNLFFITLLKSSLAVCQIDENVILNPSFTSSIYSCWLLT